MDYYVLFFVIFILSMLYLRLHSKFVTKASSLFSRLMNIVQGHTNLVFPTTMQQLGYDFNKDGQLRKLHEGKITEEKFEFNVNNDPELNQKHYEELGEAIEQYIYKLLEEEGLKKYRVPDDAEDSEPETFVFASPELFSGDTNKPLLILIHGSGVVRAGQWARRVIINDCLDNGTQIPYIRKAKELGYNVLVLNTNDNHRGTSGGLRHKIRGSEDPQRHAAYVWENYVLRKADPDKVAIVAHSFGGICTQSLASHFKKDFVKKVFAVAFTDSAHYKLEGEAFKHLRKVGRNWCASDDPLDSLVEDEDEEDMKLVSAGHTQHEMTSATAFESVFKYLEEMRGRTSECRPDKRKLSKEEEKQEVKTDVNEKKLKNANEVEPIGESPAAKKSDEKDGSEKLEPEKDGVGKDEPKEELIKVELNGETKSKEDKVEL